MKDCIFCKIINGEIPTRKVYEDDYVLVFLDTDPHQNGHMLIVPKKHYTDFTELDDEILCHINLIAKKIKDLVYEKLNAMDYVKSGKTLFGNVQEEEEEEDEL